MTTESAFKGEGRPTKLAVKIIEESLDLRRGKNVGRVYGASPAARGETRHRMKIIEINGVGLPGRRPTYKELGPTGK